LSLEFHPKLKRGSRGFTLAAGPLLLAWLAAACAAPRPVAPTATPLTPITESAARTLALAIATHDDFHFTAAAGPITNIRAELLPFPAALANLNAQQLPCGPDPTQAAAPDAVWLVTMDGDWPQNFPVLATPAPTWPPWRTLVVVLDAHTGARVCQAVRK